MVQALGRSSTEDIVVYTCQGEGYLMVTSVFIKEDVATAAMARDLYRYLIQRHRV